MVSSSEVLIAVSETILGSLDELLKVEYSKKGRKYRFVNNNFQRVREEDKHLVINPEDLDQDLALVLAYFILAQIGGGQLLSQFPDFCLCIIGVAQQLERNHWYEEENSSVIHVKYAKYNPQEVEQEAKEFSQGRITAEHIEQGLNLMICAKLNFLHTDHHIGTKVEGYYMKHFVEAYFGAEALASGNVLIALKSFVHWGNIKGILWKLDVPNVLMNPQLTEYFESFPDPLEELKLSVYDRYPLGTSKYSLIRKSIDILGDWQYSKLVPYPEGDDYNLEWLYELCHDIEKNPIKYHLRSSTKSLCTDPVNLGELSTQYAPKIKHLLTLVSLVINVFPETGGEFLLQNSKIPKFNANLIAENKSYYETLVRVNEDIDGYQSKDWDPEDIVVRLINQNPLPSLFDRVMAIREEYIDDYE